MSKYLYLCLFASMGWAAPLPFHQALPIVLERSTVIQSQKEKLNSVRARNISAGLYFLPTIDLSLTQSTDKNFRYSDAFTERIAKGTASLNLFKFGADALQYSVAQLEIQIEELSLEQAILDSEQETVVSFVNWLAEERILAVLNKLVGIQEKAFEISKKRFARGLLAKEETEKLEIDLNNILAQYREQKAKLVASQAQWSVLSGALEVHQDWPWRESLLKKLPELSPSKADENISLKIAKKKVELSEMTAKRSFRTLLPSLDLTASLGFTDALTEKLNGSTYSAGLELRVPLFDRLQDYGSYRSQVHEKERASVGVVEEQRKLQKDWSTYQSALESSWENALLREKTLQTSNHLFQVNLERFRRGLVSANEIAVDQTRLFNAEKNAIESWAEVHRNLVALCNRAALHYSRCIQ